MIACLVQHISRDFKNTKVRKFLGYNFIRIDIGWLFIVKERFIDHDRLCYHISKYGCRISDNTVSLTSPTRFEINWYGFMINNVEYHTYNDQITHIVSPNFKR